MSRARAKGKKTKKEAKEREVESLARRLEFASQQDQKEEEQQPEASRAAAEEGVPPTAVADR